MAKYIDADKLLNEINELKKSPWYNNDYDGQKWARHESVNIVVDLCIKKAPTADVQEVRHCNPNDEYCVICNSELDESYANGIWDLSREICEALNLDTESMIDDFQSNQDCVYGIIRNFIEHQNYCPHCGAKMDRKEDEE